MSGCGCGCGSGARVTTPEPAGARPGLDAIPYRSGTYRTVLDTMLARLGRHPELSPLRTREPSDWSIALLDCWAVVADITTFYTERLANEGYLPTAVHPESLQHLGRLVDHRPRPALSSDVHLAFTCEPDAVTVVPSGSQARSIPAQDELPQAFETDEDLPARAEWNTLEVRASRPQAITADTVPTMSAVTLAGTATGLRTGDRLLFLLPDVVREPQPRETAEPGPSARVVASVTPDFAGGHTLVGLAPDASESTELSAAIDHLKRTLGPVRDSPFSADPVVESAMRAIGNDQNFGFDWVATVARALAEADAIIRPRASGELLAWLDKEVAAARGVARSALDVAALAERRSSPEIQYLRDLARRVAPGDDVAVGLVAATAILPSLRRRPTTSPRVDAAGQGAAESSTLQSNALSAVLSAADPRLGSILQRAVGNQAVTPPAIATAVLAMRTSARAVTPTNGALPAGTSHLYLDGAQAGITIGSWLLIEQVVNGSVSAKARRVKSVSSIRQPIPTAPPRATPRQPAPAHTSAARPGAPDILVPVTAIEVFDDAYEPSSGAIDWTKISTFGGGESLPLAEVPLTDDVGGDRIALARVYEGLTPGRLIAVTGERTDIPGTPGITGTEVVRVVGVERKVDPDTPTDRVRPTLVLSPPLAFTYRRDSVVVRGNVTTATQGETRTEVLGSGDAQRASQTFPLRQVNSAAPLTWLPAADADGAEPALSVRVDGIEWPRVEDTLDLGPVDQVFVVDRRADGTEEVRFGDGRRGARPPTGTENVTARYRIGSGRSGNATAGQITQLASRPLGVTAVTNPLAATGGTDADGPEDIRTGIPRRSVALDRVVSVADHEAFALARAGIAKASAQRLSDGRREVLHLTVAAEDDAPLDDSGALLESLRAAISELGDPLVPVVVAARELVLLVLAAGIKVLPRYSYELVAPKVRAAALDALGFSRRQLGEPAHLSTVISALQAVSGVDYVDVDLFAGIGATTDPLALLRVAKSLGGAQQVVPATSSRRRTTVHLVEMDQPERPDELARPETLSQIALRFGLTLNELVRLNPGLTGVTLAEGRRIVVASGIRPAQLAVLSPDIPQTLILREIR